MNKPTPQIASFVQKALGKSVPVRKTVKAGSGVAKVSKADGELQVVWGEVYAPGFPDSQGDFMSAETIQAMAWGFMKKSATHKIDVQHNQIESGAYIVESFIAREDDPTFIAGSWVIGVHIPDPVLWGLVKSGELNGFSLDGFAVKVATEIEVVMPEILTGKTMKAADGHDHEFMVEFDDEGNFLGGSTTPGPDGHVHKIIGATKTEKANDHDHLFSFVEGILNVN